MDAAIRLLCRACYERGVEREFGRLIPMVGYRDEQYWLLAQKSRKTHLSAMHKKFGPRAEDVEDASVPRVLVGKGVESRPLAKVREDPAGQWRMITTSRSSPGRVIEFGSTRCRHKRRKLLDELWAEAPAAFESAERRIFL